LNQGIDRQRFASRPLVVVRRRASLEELPRVVPEACGVVWRVIRARRIAGAGRNVALYLDGCINLEVGVELDAPLAAPGTLLASATPAGTVATVTHCGPYHELAAAHRAVRAWCADQDHLLAGPSWEIYDHWQDEWNHDSSKIRTDVYYLLAPHGGALP
jgi:hypothetical protein